MLKSAKTLAARSNDRALMSAIGKFRIHCEDCNRAFKSESPRARLCHICEFVFQERAFAY